MAHLVTIQLLLAADTETSARAFATALCQSGPKSQILDHAVCSVAPLRNGAQASVTDGTLWTSGPQHSSTLPAARRWLAAICDWREKVVGQNQGHAQGKQSIGLSASSMLVEQAVRLKGAQND